MTTMSIIISLCWVGILVVSYFGAVYLLKKFNLY